MEAHDGWARALLTTVRGWEEDCGIGKSCLTLIKCVADCLGPGLHEGSVTGQMDGEGRPCPWKEQRG